MRLPVSDSLDREFSDARETLALDYRPEAIQTYATLPAGEASAPTGVAGSDGDSWYYDLYSGGPDTNPALLGYLKYLAFNEMRLSDPAVRSALWLYKLPMRAAHWDLEPGGEDPADRAVADALSQQFGLGEHAADGWLDLTWDEQITQATLLLDWGAMFEEVVWGEPRTWTDADGDEHLLRPIDRLAPRYPASVEKISTDPQTGLIRELIQRNPDTRPIPGSKLVWYVLDREGSNWYGTSLLRPMYGPWVLKKGLQIAAAIGWDRFASGVPVIRHPSGKKAEAEAIGKEIRTHERAYVALEGAPPPAGQWSFEIASISGTINDPVPLLRHYDQQIAMAAQQMFAGLGTSETGSRAVGETLSDPYYLAVSAIANGIASSKTRRLFRMWVDENFGTEVAVPRLRVSKIQAKNIPVLSGAIADLSTAGLNFTDPETIETLREILDLPVPAAVRTAIEAGRIPTAEPPIPPPLPTPQPPIPPSEGGGLGL